MKLLTEALEDLMKCFPDHQPKINTENFTNIERMRCQLDRDRICYRDVVNVNGPACRIWRNLLAEMEYNIY